MNLTHTRGDIYRALLEGIALATGHVIETYADVGAPPDRLFAVGGGTRNRVWLQSTSDATGAPQILRQRTIGASYGDAFLAAVASGSAKLEDIGTWNPVVTTVMPIPENREVFARHLSLFKRLYDQTKDLMAEIG